MLAQRWQALEYVLATQTEKPDLPASSIWNSLKHFELEPPLSGATINSTLLSRSVTGAAQEDRLFDKIKGDRKKEK